MTRRRWIRLCGAAGAGSLLGGAAKMGQNRAAAVAAVDHLLLGAADLEQGIAWVENLTGVKAVAGGSHPGVGTRNALASLGGRRYLEIIAPDPAQAAYRFHIDLRHLVEPRLVAWAAVTADIDAAADKARQAGYQLFGPQEGSRARPDGRLLQWKTLGVLNDFGIDGVEPMPFFIEWAADSVHPSQDSPGGCDLESFVLRHPDALGLTEALKRLGVEADVEPASAAGLKATLASPKGKVELD
jgi:hypothetical protein